ncbi:hypothetical protein DPMN_128293 [Dreissena polymorpha]|uniref:Uncharacterized protein n=1 Tax=Dreissena polymorpha TaxID=45954 RepID=A0A9D4GZ91_DREPO|nr:hypothetical protein DPMN_128293 [Dreissena polymorpha]
MKAVLVICFLIGLAMGEYCSTARDCRNEQCNNGTTVICPDDNICTCGTVQVETICRQKSDCDTYFNTPGHPCSNSRRHCVDGKCVCY